MNTHALALRRGEAQGLPTPSISDRWVAASTVGHLARDTIHRDVPSVRGDNCATNVDGYTEAGAPAMLTMGTSQTPGTVEHAVSQDENTLADLRRQQHGTGAPYPATERRDDQREIVRTAVSSQQQMFPRALHNTETPGARGQAPTVRRMLAQERARSIGQGAMNPTASLGDTSRVPIPAPAPGEATTPQIDNKNKAASAEEQAMECINNYCESLEQPAARVEAINREIAAQQARTGPEPVAHAAEQTRRDQAETTARAALTKATADRATADARLTAAQSGLPPPGSPAGTAAQDVASANRAQIAAAATEATRRSEHDVAQRRATNHRRSVPAEQIACLEAQRARILSGNPVNRGAVPAA